MLRCTQSLVTSINQADDDIILRVFDDHSPSETMTTLRRILGTCKHPVEFVALETRGYNASCLASFSKARNDGRELLYLVEDDYLHAPSAIQEMLEVHVVSRRDLAVAKLPCIRTTIRRIIGARYLAGRTAASYTAPRDTGAPIRTRLTPAG